MGVIKPTIRKKNVCLLEISSTNNNGIGVFENGGGIYPPWENIYLFHKIWPRQYLNIIVPF
jgi:hypothetical protein